MTEVQRREQARVFDAIGAQYTEAFADRPGQLAAGAWLLKHLVEPDRRPVVLDVGCGSGMPTALQLTSGGCCVVGVDTSPVMLDLARENVPRGKFVERDLTQLGDLHPRGEKFDAAVAFFSLLMLPRSDVGRALDAIHEVLAPGGLFALGMVEGDANFMPREFLGAPVRLTAFPREQLAALLTDHGFVIAELSAEPWLPRTPDAPEQVHVYARCAI